MIFNTIPLILKYSNTQILKYSNTQNYHAAQPNTTDVLNFFQDTTKIFNVLYNPFSEPQFQVSTWTM